MIQLEDFLWFEGTVRYDGTEADWELYELGTYAPLLAIGWEKDYEQDTWVMKYEIVHTDNAEFGTFETASYYLSLNQVVENFRGVMYLCVS